MHTIVRYYIKTSIVFLFTGIISGFYMLIIKEIPGQYPDSQIITAHTHVILVGFVMMMIFGVAQWMFPRPSKEDKHYSPQRALFIFWLMAISIIIRTISEILNSFLSSFVLSGLIILGSLGEATGIILFFYNMWTRIRPVGSHIREAEGEKF
ncbi:MAG: cbb3-type cytochrome c oxidase subunit I [Acidobacteriota bacterium]